MGISLWLIFILFEIPLVICADTYAYVVPTSCQTNKNFRQYFLPTILACSDCPQPISDNVVDAQHLSCVCGNQFYNDLITTVLPIDTTRRCKKCPSGLFQSADGLGCIDCGNRSSDVACLDCPPGYISVERDIDGSFARNSMSFPISSCIPCVGKTTPSLDGKSCIPCVKNLDPNSTTCQCKGSIVADYCFPTTARTLPTNDRSNIVTPDIWGSLGSGIRSLLFVDGLRPSYTLCRDYLVEDQCQILAQFCVLLIYRTPDQQDTNACSYYDQLSQSTTISDLAVKRLLPTLRVQRSYNDYSQLTGISQVYSVADPSQNKFEFVVAVFQQNGSFAGYMPFFNMQILSQCNIPLFVRQAAVTVGILFEYSCEFSSVVTSQLATEFYELYLKFVPPSSPAQLFPVSVLIQNIPANSQSSDSSWIMVRRFFMVDTISFVEKRNQPATYIRYASALSLTITYQEELQQTGLIYAPVLRLSYNTVPRSQVDVQSPFYIALSTVHKMGLANYFRDVEVGLAVVSALAAVYSIILSIFWIRRRGGGAFSLVDIFQFILILIGQLSNAFFWCYLGISIYWLTFFKKQDVVYRLLPTSEQEQNFRVIIICAFVLKLIDVCHMIVHQSTCDIFFMDWEKPHYQTINAEGRQMTKETPISIWRTYFAANEWMEIQTKRKISRNAHLMLTLFFLVFVGFENWATAEPGYRFSYADNMYKPPYSSLLRFAVGASVMLVIGLIQLLFTKLIYERFFDNILQNYVDLCSYANISVFIMSQYQYGYYIHGKSVTNVADTNLRGMFEHFQKEANDQVPRPGLDGTDKMTFVMVIPVALRRKYDQIYGSVLKTLSAGASGGVPLVAGATQQDQRRGQQQENLCRGYDEVNKLLQNFVEHCSSVCDYRIQRRRWFEDLCNTEFIPQPNAPVAVDEPAAPAGSKPAPIDVGFFYHVGDNKQEAFFFEEMLFYGHEFRLLLLDILFFCFVDLLAAHFVLAIILTYLLGRCLYWLRDTISQRNLAKKTLVDKRFLI